MMIGQVRQLSCIGNSRAKEEIQDRDQSDYLLHCSVGCRLAID